MYNKNIKIIVITETPRYEIDNITVDPGKKAVYKMNVV